MSLEKRHEKLALEAWKIAAEKFGVPGLERTFRASFEEAYRSYMAEGNRCARNDNPHRGGVNTDASVLRYFHEAAGHLQQAFSDAERQEAKSFAHHFGEAMGCIMATLQYQLCAENFFHYDDGVGAAGDKWIPMRSMRPHHTEELTSQFYRSGSAVHTRLLQLGIRPDDDPLLKMFRGAAPDDHVQRVLVNQFRLGLKNSKF